MFYTVQLMLQLIQTGFTMNCVRERSPQQASFLTELCHSIHSTIRAYRIITIIQSVRKCNTCLLGIKAATRPWVPTHEQASGGFFRMAIVNFTNTITFVFKSQPTAQPAGKQALSVMQRSLDDFLLCAGFYRWIPEGEHVELVQLEMDAVVHVLWHLNVLLEKTSEQWRPCINRQAEVRGWLLTGVSQGSLGALSKRRPGGTLMSPLQTKITKLLAESCSGMGPCEGGCWTSVSLESPV